MTSIMKLASFLSRQVVASTTQTEKEAKDAAKGKDCKVVGWN